MSAFAAVAFFLLLALGACLDARWRRFPNWLAVACAATALCAVWAEGGLSLVGARLVASGVVCGALVLFELGWRRVRHAAGLGLGDVKALFSLVLYRPIAGIMSFGVALVFLAITCLVTKRRSLPLLPFLVPVFAIMSLTGIVPV